MVDDEGRWRSKVIGGTVGRWLVLVDSTKEYMIRNLRSVKSVFKFYKLQSVSKSCFHIVLPPKTWKIMIQLNYRSYLLKSRALET